jgi:AcrR family transcriptional regulator
MIVARTASQPRRQPRQMRSRTTFDAILEAAAQILVKAGSVAFNTNDVAAKAGVSIGTLYQYFPDKESLVAELKRRNTQELARSVHEIFDGAGDRSMAETMRAAIRALIARHTLEPVLHRVLDEEIIVLPELSFSDTLKLDGIRDIRAFLDRHKQELVVADLDLASFIIARTFRNIMLAALKTFPDKLASGAIENELTGFAMRYLTGKS